MHRWMSIIVVMGLLIAGCSQTDRRSNVATSPDTPAVAQPGPATSPTPGSGSRPRPAGRCAAGRTEVTVYYVHSAPTEFYLAPERRCIVATSRVATAALAELLAGRPQDPDHLPSGALPGTRVRSVTIRRGVATVDWSREVLRGRDGGGMGSAQEANFVGSVLYTLTEFPTIERVRFIVEGEAPDDWWGHGEGYDRPFGRGDEPWRSIEPVAVWTPTEGARAERTLRVTGRVVGAPGAIPRRVTVIVRDATGRVVVDSSVRTDADPQRAWARMFDATVRLPAPTTPEQWRVEVLAQDGGGFVEDRGFVAG